MQAHSSLFMTWAGGGGGVTSPDEADQGPVPCFCLVFLPLGCFLGGRTWVALMGELTFIASFSFYMFSMCDVGRARSTAKSAGRKPGHWTWLGILN
jgi:hypothetical protein